jgi:hypothetical protein
MKEVPLSLKDAHYKSLSMVPTEDKTKPVIVLECPFTVDLAIALGSSWLFDSDQTPVNFGGSISIPIDYVNAELHMGTGRAGRVVKTQKIRNFNVSHADKKEDDEEDTLVLSCRVHLPNIDVEKEPEFSNYVETLKFLVRLNKKAIDVGIRPVQQPLFGAGPAEESALARVIEFKSKIKSKDAIILKISLEPVEGGFNCGYELKGVGLPNEPGIGEQISDGSTVFESEGNAIVWACSEMLEFMGKAIDADSADEKKAVNTIRKWIFAQAPGLEKKAEATQ